MITESHIVLLLFGGFEAKLQCNSWTHCCLWPAGFQRDGFIEEAESQFVT